VNKTLKTRKDQILLVAIGTGAVVAVLWFALLSGQYQTLKQTRQQGDEMRDKVTRAENLLRRAPQIEEELEHKTGELLAIEDTMAWGDIYSRTLNTLNHFIRDHLVSFNTSDLSREVIADVSLLPNFPYQSASFVVKVTAHYHDFGVFLADLENSFPYLRVQNLELIPVPKPLGPNTEKLECKFEIVMLVKPGGS
jgi:Tfp pilus assembly protein PilO